MRLVDPMDELLMELRNVRKEIEDKRTLEKELLATIWDMVGDRRSRKFGASKATFVRSKRSAVNEEGLRKAIPAALWHRLTKEVLDPIKFEKALVEQELDPVVVQLHTTVTEVKQIRFSKGDESDD